MTDRIHSFQVILDKDIREDDAEAIVNAMRCIKHVVAVEPIVADPTSMMAEHRARIDLSDKLWEVLHPKK